MRSDRMQIRADLRQDRRLSIGVWVGELDEQGDEVWAWLPKKLIRYKWCGRQVRVTLPYWLAQRESLLKRLSERLDTVEARLDRIEKHLGPDRREHHGTR